MLNLFVINTLKFHKKQFSFDVMVTLKQRKYSLLCFRSPETALGHVITIVKQALIGFFENINIKLLENDINVKYVHSVHKNDFELFKTNIEIYC